MTREELRVYHREWRRRRRACLTPAEQDKLCEYDRQTRQTPARREYERLRSKRRRQTLTAEQRERRNAYQRAYARRHYANVRTEWRAFRDWLKSAPCADCGQTFPPCVMDFDHRDPAAKSTQMTKLLFSSYEKYQAELMKCDLVCANCHRIRTHVHGRGSMKGKFKQAKAA